MFKLSPAVFLCLRYAKMCYVISIKIFENRRREVAESVLDNRTIRNYRMVWLSKAFAVICYISRLNKMRPPELHAPVTSLHLVHPILFIFGLVDTQPFFIGRVYRHFG